MLYLLYLVIFLVWNVFPLSSQNVDLCATAQGSCGDCVSAHPDCAWCADVFENSVRASMRCHNARNNQTCGLLVNPKSTVTNSQNQPFSAAASVSSINSTDFITFQPQASELTLRVGQPLKMNVTFRKLLDYPLDLYYLLDLSYSMKDDLQQLQNLGQDLVDNIRSNVTQNVNLGFGTFVDKVLLPYATNQTSVFERICEGECQRAFGFHHQVPLTSTGEEFREAVATTIISANLDTPEGGFDALMQIAVCMKEVGWRRDALHVVLFTSDAPSHVALDGKLAGLFNKNDLKCYLEKDADGSGVYTYSRSKYQDYPSVGQLRKVFEENKIEVIFAVTDNVYGIYQNLDKVLPATVQILQSDSGNIISVISEAYDKIKSQFRMNSFTLPPNVDVSVNVLCPGSRKFKENMRECGNVSVGDEVVFELELMATSCPSSRGQVDVIPLTFSAVNQVVNLTIGYHCDCDCPSTDMTDSASCNGQGNRTCGICECAPGRSGTRCQCAVTASEAELEKNCTDPNIKAIPNQICNNNGLCECGDCSSGCYQGHSGQYCQCRDTGCPVDTEGNICGGPTQGVCNNCYDDGACVCNATTGWHLSPTRLVCDCNDNLCKANPSDASLCSGNGECDCKDCVCNNNSMYWTGKYCNTCVHPSCSSIEGTCDNAHLRACAECVYTYVSTEECIEVCRNPTIHFRSVDSLPDCSSCSTSSDPGCEFCADLNEEVLAPLSCSTIRDIDQCKTSYVIGWNRNPPLFSVLVQRRNQENDCPEPVDPLFIILPVAGGVLLIGIIAVIVWKCIVHNRDKRLYEEFVEDLHKRKWGANDNQIYVGASSHFKNPNFIGDENSASLEDTK